MNRVQTGARRGHNRWQGGCRRGGSDSDGVNCILFPFSSLCLLRLGFVSPFPSKVLQSAPTIQHTSFCWGTLAGGGAESEGKNWAHSQG